MEDVFDRSTCGAPAHPIGNVVRRNAVDHADRAIKIMCHEHWVSIVEKARFSRSDVGHSKLPQTERYGIIAGDVHDSDDGSGDSSHNEHRNPNR
jgi:hypothetical protein